jgi:hypothetical protein
MELFMAGRLLGEIRQHEIVSTYLISPRFDTLRKDIRTRIYERSLQGCRCNRR